jgi:hypothetical protein
MAIKRIRMLKAVGLRLGRVYQAGRVLEIPGDLDNESAKAWIAAGLAIEDKIDPRRLETKAKEA